MNKIFVQIADFVTGEYKLKRGITLKSIIYLPLLFLPFFILTFLRFFLKKQIFL